MKKLKALNITPIILGAVLLAVVVFFVVKFVKNRGAYHKTTDVEEKNTIVEILETELKDVFKTTDWRFEGTDFPLKKGSKGSLVAVLQSMLNVFNFIDNKNNRLVEDGVFGQKTEDAIMPKTAFHTNGQISEFDFETITLNMNSDLNRTGIDLWANFYVPKNNTKASNSMAAFIFSNALSRRFNDVFDANNTIIKI